MMKRPILASALLCTTLLGTAVLAPGTASAAGGCPSIGATRFYGDCAPRSDFCEKHVVVGLTGDYYGRNGYVADIYHRNSRGWYFKYSMTALCNQW